MNLSHMDLQSLLNRTNLRIARENAGYSSKSISKKLTQTGKDVVVMWESGEKIPSLRQIERLAKEYQISPLLLLSDKELEREKTIPDYRLGQQDDDKGKEKINKLITLVLKRQKWLEAKYKELKLEKNALLGIATNYSSPLRVAELLRQRLEVNYEDIKLIKGVKSREKVLKYYTERIENYGVFVAKTIAYHRITVDEMRGLFISNHYTPTIVINRQDALSAQIFTLIHEAAHLLRSTDGISNVDFRSMYEDSNLDHEERFCNQVAAEFLLPKSEITKRTYRFEDIDELSLMFKVSKLFIFYRLKSLRKIPQQMQDELERRILKESRDGVEKNKAKRTGGDYTNNMRDSNGTLFNRFVQSMYLDKAIGYSEATNLLKFSVERV